MARVKRLVLDVLKPHQPDNLTFASALAESGTRQRVKLVVTEMDENTETLEIVVEGDDVDFAALKKAIEGQGGALHGIDEVEVEGVTGA